MHLSLNLDEATLARFCETHHIRRLSLFGSQLKGTAKPDSDIDLLVEFEADARIGLFEFAAMEREFAALLARKVDLVSKRGLKPRVRPYVLKDARVVYAA